MKQVEKRTRAILNKLQKENRVYVSDLGKEFGISEVTIRKDLKRLEDQGLLKRTHGGATVAAKAAIEPSLEVLEQTRIVEKKAIAEAAYRFISDHDAILLDASTTTRELARLIAAGDRKLTIITTAVQVSYELAKNPLLEVIQIGGTIRRSLFTTMGPLATDALRRLHVDKAFIGVNGIDPAVGITTQHLMECEIKRLIIEASTQSFVLADSSKMRCVSLGVICPINRLDYIITDAGTPREFADALEGCGAEVVIAAGPDAYEENTPL